MIHSPGILCSLMIKKTEIVGVLDANAGYSTEFSVDESLFIPYHILAQFLKNPQITKITIKANSEKSVKQVKIFLKSFKDYMVMFLITKFRIKKYF